MVRRHELEDHEWELIADLLPPRHRMGRPPRDQREIMNGMMWILRTGAPWRDLPERYGPWSTVYWHFRQWARNGLLDAIVGRLQLRLDEAGYVEWDLWCVDGSSVRAAHAAAGGGKGGLVESRQTMP